MTSSAQDLLPCTENPVTEMPSSAQDYFSCSQILRQHLADKLSNEDNAERTGCPINATLRADLKSVRDTGYLLGPDKKYLSKIYKKLDKLVMSWGDHGGEDDKERRKLLHLMEKLGKAESPHGNNWEKNIWADLSEMWRKD